MQILIIEDLLSKREQIAVFLEEKNIKYEVIEYVGPAFEYILGNKEEISGIILDLGLAMSKDLPETYNLYRGLDVIYELDRLNIQIPILINSSTFVGMLDDYPFVYGQRTKSNNYQMLEDFIDFLTQREEQK